ncbi:MAG: hypothetical protein KAT17_09030 [Candidatus Aminicenantes bacterium]|nr:hypothetical protein [Candidatus Aminicenantes bacterium]
MDKLKVGMVLIGFVVMILSEGILYPSEPSLEIQMQDFSENVNWLESMVREVKKDKDTYWLVQSYEAIEDRCWIYDEALAVIAFTALRQFEIAEKILDTLKVIQNPDGSFYFSYQISTLTATSKRRYTGSIAWIAMAINFYRSITNDSSYNVLLWKTLRWLGTQQVMDREKKTFGGVSLGVRDDAFSMEHNLDTYSAFYHYHNKYFRKRAKKIKQFILKHLYRKTTEPRFMTGYRDHSLYLDCQSWAVLTLGKKYCQVLPFAEKRFLVKNGTLGDHTDIEGFFERQAENAPVWSEGTEGMALAYFFCDRTKEGDFYHRQVKKMMGKNGGIVYATENKYEFSTSTSVAGTTWYIFYEMKLNPFNPGRKTRKSVKSFLKKRKVLTKKL